MFRPFSKKAIKSPLAPGGPAPQRTLYHMHQTRQPHPGAMSYAFDPLTSLPLFNVLGNTILANKLQPLQPAPAIARQVSLTSGVGGIVAGQYMLQPLIDPNGHD